MRKFIPLLLLSVVFMVSCKKDKYANVLLVHKFSPVDGTQMVPAKVVTGYGDLDIIYNKTTKVLNFTVRWQLLTGAPTGIGIHGLGPLGVNAGLVQNFSSGFPTTTTGSFSNTLLVDGVAIKEADLLRGAYYLAIRTAANPTGEIRGQIIFYKEDLEK